LRVVADSLALSQFAIRHEIKLAVVFGKPDRRVYSGAAFSEGGEADVMLAVDFVGDGRHPDIVKGCERSLYQSRKRNFQPSFKLAG
jgi:hypothetical protein